VLAVVPARGGSKGLPGKNLRALGGRSLLEHAIRFAFACESVGRVVVSTDSEEIAAAARAAGADVPFLRPAELAGDETPMWPVIVHALAQVEREGEQWEYLLLADPTSPVRSPADVATALERLRADPDADGIVSVADPGFNPAWQCVIEEDGYMAHLVPDGTDMARRQDAPEVRYIDGSFYLWRPEFARGGHTSWFEGRMLMHPVESFGSIDTADELTRLEALVAAGVAVLPT
jgi:CMP-N-acetylneuraminic acid synthetase